VRGAGLRAWRSSQCTQALRRHHTRPPTQRAARPRSWPFRGPAHGAGGGTHARSHARSHARTLHAPHTHLRTHARTNAHARTLARSHARALTLARSPQQRDDSDQASRVLPTTAIEAMCQWPRQPSALARVIGRPESSAGPPMAHQAMAGPHRPDSDRLRGPAAALACGYGRVRRADRRLRVGPAAATASGSSDGPESLASQQQQVERAAAWAGPVTGWSFGHTAGVERAAGFGRLCPSGRLVRGGGSSWSGWQGRLGGGDCSRGVGGGRVGRAAA